MRLNSLPSGVQLGVISNGTLNPRHLIPTFLDLLSKLSESRAEIVRNVYKDVIDANFGEGSNEFRVGIETDIASMMEQLWDDIEELLPKGLFFGAIEGDGACFAIQQVPVEDYDPDDNVLLFRRK